MKRKIIASLCCGFTALALAPTSVVAQSALEQRVKQMEQELKQLKALIKSEEQNREKEVAEVNNKVDVVAKEKSGANVKLSSGTTLSYGGFIKVNAMYSDYQDGPVPSASVASRILVPSLIPVGGEGESAKFDSDVVTSRLFFKTATDTSAGKIKSHFEFDLLSGGGDERISNSTNLRVRHAYFDWGMSDTSSLLVGQTWSTFFNVGSLPGEVEFIGPTSGTIFNRQAQIRWTKKLGGGGSFMLAAENPSTSLAEAGRDIAGSNFDDSSIPDIVARYNGKTGKHSYSFAAVARDIAYDDGVFEESKTGIAANFSGKYAFDNGNEIKYSIATGNLGRYIALNAFRDGGIDAAGNLDLTSVTGGYVSYKHKWNAKLHSVLTYALSTADLANGLSSANTETVDNFNVNLIYSPTPKLSFGAAVIQASRELENGTDGDLTRFQLTAKYGF